MLSRSIMNVILSYLLNDCLVIQFAECLKVPSNCSIAKLLNRLEAADGDFFSSFNLTEKVVNEVLVVRLL